MRKNKNILCPSCAWDLSKKKIKIFVHNKNFVICPQCRRRINKNYIICRQKTTKIVVHRTAIKLKFLKQKFIPKGKTDKIEQYTKLDYIKDFYDATGTNI